MSESEELGDAFPAVRAGIAYGPVVNRLGDVYGSTVNVASRLTSVARPGSVVIDRGAYAALSGDEDGEPGAAGDDDAADSGEGTTRKLKCPADVDGGDNSGRAIRNLPPPQSVGKPGPCFWTGYRMVT